ncbi:hypothetical protein HFO42_07500 [Rhizobium leguminosarum]|uniref:Uncharacterized protein n=1 Tax=Rhizobium leguminosarum TaxID=384 RepID=A0AAJ1A6E1_RHILE|nr:hypothetical protein [Rhizobium leguminosarum]MBY5532838.1 hypothetical protein [Rhizobium leguminosarum]MBY5594284.1 hypothetical protein [Rhizobium leguminosarum]MBY5627961.1 hypothetical protein [Rhizobium leguminosarum]
MSQQLHYSSRTCALAWGCSSRMAASYLAFLADALSTSTQEHSPSAQGAFSRIGRPPVLSALEKKLDQRRGV